LDGIENVSTGQINGRGRLQRQIDVRPVRRDQGPHNIGDPSTGQKMAFKILGG